MRGLIDSGLVRRGAARAEDAQWTPTQRNISPSILAYADKGVGGSGWMGLGVEDVGCRA